MANPNNNITKSTANKANMSLVISVLGQKSTLKTSFILALADLFIAKNINFGFVKASSALDIDKSGKDSDILFKSGADYTMVITNDQRYLKSSENFFNSELFGQDKIVILQENSLLDSDINIFVSDNNNINKLDKSAPNVEHVIDAMIFSDAILNENNLEKFYSYFLAGPCNAYKK